MITYLWPHAAKRRLRIIVPLNATASQNVIPPKQRRKNGASAPPPSAGNFVRRKEVETGFMAGYTMHVISHTHWDREWYLTFQQFRMRLVDLVDNLLNLLDRDSDFKYFNFDGQTIVYAWKLLMQNHPHDSICGCSIDQVHAEMMPRFAQVQQIGEELTHRALDFVAGKVHTTEYANLFVFNPLNHDRSEVIKATVEFPLGPPTRSGVHPIIDQAKGTDVLGIEVVDDEGNPVLYQIVNTEVITKQILSPIELPMAQNFRRYDLLISAQDIPACGYKIFGVQPSHERPTGGSLSLEPNVLENENLRVEIQTNGSLTVKDKNIGRIPRSSRSSAQASAHAFVNCNVFEDVGDVGDEYRHVKPLQDRIYTTLSSSPSVSKVLDGPLCTKYRVTYDFAIPASSAQNDKTRSDALTVCRIITDVQLRKNSPMVEFTTTVTNTAKDHRLRVLFPSGIQTDFSHAEGQFDVLTRPVRPPANWVNAKNSRCAVFGDIHFPICDVPSRWHMGRR